MSLDRELSLRMDASAPRVPAGLGDDGPGPPGAELGRNLGRGRPRKSLFGPLLFALYGRTGRPRLRQALLKMALRLEGRAFLSVTARRIMAEYHDVHIGQYTHGACFVPGAMDAGTRVGRYTSIALTARRMARNHPMRLRSMHAFFFNEKLAAHRKKIVPHSTVTIGNDVWIGHNAILLPGVTTVGDGAVIGAGAVVNRDVPPYALVIGNPGRVVGYRFSKETREGLLESRWWERSYEELLPDLASFRTPLEAEADEE